MTTRVPLTMIGLAPSGADDTAAIQTAMDRGAVRLGPGIFSITNLTTTRATQIEGAGAATTLRLAAGSGAGITLAHAGSSLRNLHLDGNTQGRSGVRVTAADCEVDLTAANVDGAAASPADTSVLVVEADRCTFSVVARDCPNTGNVNDSTPRVVTVQATADRAHGRLVKGDAVNCGVVLGSATGTTTLDVVDLHAVADNGLYQLGGVAAVGQLRAQEYDEALVALGDITVAHLEVVGAGSAAVNLENAGAVTIGHLVARSDASGSPSSLARTRAGNTASGALSILSCDADIEPATLMLLSTGTVDKVTLRDARIRNVYDSATPSVSISSWWSWAGVKEFDIRDVSVHIVDSTDALTSADQFQFVLPTTNLARQSYYANVDVYLTNADGTTASGAGFRGVNVAQALIVASGAMWRADIGPYTLAVTSNNGIRDSIGAIPVVGTWRKGTDFILWGAAVAPFRTRCTVAGTPGTWVSY